MPNMERPWSAMLRCLGTTFLSAGLAVVGMVIWRTVAVLSFATMTVPIQTNIALSPETPRFGHWVAPAVAVIGVCIVALMVACVIVGCDPVRRRTIACFAFGPILVWALGTIATFLVGIGSQAPSGLLLFLSAESVGDYVGQSAVVLLPTAVTSAVLLAVRRGRPDRGEDLDRRVLADGQ